MHPITAITHWSHHWHDHMLMLRHHISDHLHSRHFWAGVVLTLLILGIAVLLFTLARNAPYIYPTEMPPFAPYGV